MDELYAEELETLGKAQTLYKPRKYSITFLSVPDITFAIRILPRGTLWFTSLKRVST